ncbi:hypothetical protein GUITHDRAFT_110193 [Guillardia theta CCMP2712]|uniref:EF-hand domain-containing protein n=1 Tax=Guillardia theta (strain CCMP2712) TaxID=905079 RepID=L1J5B9_GUITC|nr:hypothetical protein GUITHDRAFT_110193 [Guillardia theta CCMP2712]EKX43738.1 hypothetical protein GUITHDRAFT_110193 [Guillardia theta CCMP2712]|eukprot:XP_005830718.1 hypothetical protein GUITHDRAFT_110193 [Guillardia theta CCMP2712]
MVRRLACRSMAMEQQERGSISGILPTDRASEILFEFLRQEMGAQGLTPLRVSEILVRVVMWCRGVQEPPWCSFRELFLCALVAMTDEYEHMFPEQDRFAQDNAEQHRELNEAFLTLLYNDVHVLDTKYIKRALSSWGEVELSFSDLAAPPKLSKHLLSPLAAGTLRTTTKRKKRVSGGSAEQTMERRGAWGFPFSSLRENAETEMKKIYKFYVQVYMPSKNGLRRCTTLDSSECIGKTQDPIDCSMLDIVNFSKTATFRLFQVDMTAHSYFLSKLGDLNDFYLQQLASYQLFDKADDDGNTFISFTEFMSFMDSFRRFEQADKVKIWKMFDENGGLLIDSFVKDIICYKARREL